MLNKIKKQSQSCLLGFLLTIFLFPFQVSANNLELYYQLISNVTQFKDRTNKQPPDQQALFSPEKIRLAVSIQKNLKDIQKQASSQHINTEEEEARIISLIAQLKKDFESIALTGPCTPKDIVISLMENIKKSQSYLKSIHRNPMYNQFLEN